MNRAEGDESQEYNGETVHQDCKENEKVAGKQEGRRTPITSPLGLFLTVVEHGRHDHEAWSNCAFTSSKNESYCEQSTEGVTRSMATQRDGPNEDVDTGEAR